MANPASWQTAFVATTVALGDSTDDALASLDEADVATAQTLVVKLSHDDRSVRARALASALGVVALDLQERRLA